jgi:hypothetical protein
MHLQLKMNRADADEFISHYKFQTVFKGVAIDEVQRGISSQVWEKTFSEPQQRN